MTDFAIGLRFSYDTAADVMYVTFGDSFPARYEEDEQEEGVIWRISVNGTPCGVTILDFREYWAGRQTDLLRLVDRIRLPHEVAAHALEIAS